MRHIPPAAPGASRERLPRIAVMSDLHMDTDVSGRAVCRECRDELVVRRHNESLTCRCGASSLTSGPRSGCLTGGSAEGLPARLSWGDIARAGDADLVLLAGDVHRGADAVRWAASEFQGMRTVMLPGNREFYGDDMAATAAAMQSAASMTENVTVLDNSSLELVIRGRKIRILGTTLWSDFRLLVDAGVSKAEAMEAEDVKVRLRNENEYLRITAGGELFSTATMLGLHEKARDWLAGELAAGFDGMTVVATHHAPVAEGVNPKFAGNATQASFASDLSGMLAGAGPDLVVWGHTHAPDVDFRTGRTRMLSRQRGYSHEGRFDFSPVFADVGAA